MKSPYTPNFSDPRVVKRIRIALGFVKGVLSETKPHEWSTLYLDKFLGHQSSELGKYLREKLIITTDNHYSFTSGEKVKCKKHIANSQGIEELLELVEERTKPYCITSQKRQRDYQLVTDSYNERFHEELTSKQFVYKDASSRLCHPIQSLKREYKVGLLADHGLCYQYDIDCCAPTLIMQYAEQCEMDLYLFAIRGYLKNKQQYREELAEDLMISEHSVKVLINALFNGAKIGHNKDFATYDLLLGDPVRINKAKVNPFLIGLRADIKVCWDYIEPYTVRRTKVMDNGKERKIPMSPKTKWNVYFDQERRVNDAVSCYLNTIDNCCFLEHDGWTCEKPLDADSLIAYVRDTTGFRITLQFLLQ